MHKAINGKFKKGDKVVSRMSGRRGCISEVYGEGWYAVHFDDDRIDLDNKMQEYQLRAANCSTANSVVAKAVANARAANSSAEPTVAKNGAMEEYEDELRELQSEIDKCYHAFAAPVEQSVKAADFASSTLSRYMSKFEAMAKALEGDGKNEMLAYARIGRDIVKAMARAGQQIAEIGKTVKREVY